MTMQAPAIPAAGSVGAPSDRSFVATIGEDGVLPPIVRGMVEEMSDWLAACATGAWSGPRIEGVGGQPPLSGWRSRTMAGNGCGPPTVPKT